jgi:hypothetical protein
LPKPKRRTQSSKRRAPRRWPIFTVPTLLDWARICAVVRSTVPRSCDSLIVRSATVIVGGRWKMSVGLTTFSSSAAATVKGLNVEPGS